MTQSTTLTKDVRRIWVGGDEGTMLYIARVSNPANQNSENSRLLHYCIKNGHWSVFEQANMCLELKTSRAISAQIIRHRSFAFQEFSQRYAALDDTGIIYYAARRQDNKNRQNSIDDLPIEIQTEWYQRQVDNWKRSFEHYQWALDNGIAKECARMVLPMQSSTKIYMNGTVRSWIHYITLRTHESTQKEHRDLAEQCKFLFTLYFPITAEALGWHYV